MVRFFSMETSGAVVDAGGGGAVGCVTEGAAAKELSLTSGVNGTPKLDARGLGVTGNLWSVTFDPSDDPRPPATVKAFRKPLEARDSTLISGRMGGFELIRYLDETTYAGEGGTGKSRVLEATDNVLSPDVGRTLESRFLWSIAN